jgi:hypothetical protein
MSAWTKLPALTGRPNPCLNCPPIEATLEMDHTIAVGFGQAFVAKDDETVYYERYEMEEGDYWTVADAERAAAADPDHDWRIVLDGPMHGETYQRQGEGRWVLVDKNDGFA